MTCCRVSKKAATISIWICLVLLVFSVVMVVMFPTLYKVFLDKSIALTEGSIITNYAWKDLPLPIYERVYFFNITNMDKFLEGSEPLNVSEVGPYTYKGRWTKNYIVWNSNDTVSYRETRTYQFVPDMSIGSQEDEIYTLNGPLIIAASIAESYGEYERTALSVLLGIYGEKVVIKRKIKELAYDGYEDFIIKYGKYIIKNLPYQDGIFSWLYGKNATDDGLFNVYTGADDVSKIDILDRWNGEDKLNFWKGDTCNMMNGTSIETGPPLQDTQESYSFFQSIFCRTLAFEYDRDTEHYGVKAKRFKSTYSLFANSTENPDNYCYEVHGERPSGILDISPCQFGAPAFISFPHFLSADPSYFDAVSGLSPKEEEHGSFIEVEPVTGLSISIAVRFQINIELSKVEGILQTYSPSKGVLPVLWVDIHAEVTEDLADFLTSQTKNPKIIAYAVLGGLMVVSAVITVVCFFILCSQKDDDDVPLLDAIKAEYSEYCGKALSSSENCAADDEKSGQEKLTGSSKFKQKNSEGDKTDESLVKI